MNKFYTSATITLGGFAATAVAGAVIASAGLAVVPSAIAGIMVGVAIGFAEDAVRKKNGLSTS